MSSDTRGPSATSTRSSRWRTFWGIHEDIDDDEVAALIDVEYARFNVGPHPDDQALFRRLATLTVGYRLGIQVMRALFTGGAR